VVSVSCYGVTLLSFLQGDLLQACTELLLSVPPGSGLLGGRAVLPLRLGLERGAAGAPGLASAVINALERWEREKPEELEVRFFNMNT